MISFIVEAVVVAASSWLFTGKYFGLRSFSESVLTCFILFFGQIVLVELFLGSIGLLYFGNVFLMHLLVLILAFSCCPRKITPLFLKPDIGFFINSKLLILAFSVFAAFFLVKGYINLVNPPFNTDSMFHHLAFPAAWIKSASLTNPFLIFGSRPIPGSGLLDACMISYYPINAELFFAWLMMPLRNAFLADMGQAPFYIIGIIAVYAILRKYSLDRKIALLSGFLLMLIPNIFKQLRSGSLVDVICAVLLLLVLNTLLKLKLDFTFRNAFLFGITAGLFVGTKVINLVWLAALFPLTSYIFYKGLKAEKFRPGKILGFAGIILS
ncbi:MAG: hypothetical protein PHN57_09065, partial [Candidatus Omnitrophica bacterium]|nr:hypothetical protein [Candidatus Omnitrophota bacterium]